MKKIYYCALLSLTMISCSNSMVKTLDDIVNQSPIKDPIIAESAINEAMVELTSQDLKKTICTFSNPTCTVDSFELFYYKATKKASGFYDMLIVQRDTTSYPTSEYYYLVFDNKAVLKSKTLIWSITPDSEYGEWLTSLRMLEQNGIELTYTTYDDTNEKGSKNIKTFTINEDGTITTSNGGANTSSTTNKNNFNDLGLISIIGNVIDASKDGATITLTVDMGGARVITVNTANKNVYIDQELLTPEHFTPAQVMGKMVVIRAVEEGENGYEAYSIFEYKENAFESAPIAIALDVYKSLTEMGEIVRRGKKEEMVCLFEYPFNINADKTITINNKQEALQQFDRIFSPKVKMALLNTTFDDAFATCQGVAIASGTIWFQPHSENDSELRIYVINEN